MKKFIILTFTMYFIVLGLFSQQMENVILPKPLSIKKIDGNFRLPEELSLYAPKAWMEANYFIDEIKDVCGLKSKISHDPHDYHLWLDVDNSVVTKKEGYRLIITEDTITITGHDNAGVFYGLQSLIQLIYHGKPEGQLSARIIDDAPEFPWRAYMIDEGRYFKGEKEVYQILDEMAALKFNILHWHLTDDGGWRIEIKKYPKLTEIGSKRKDSEIGTWGSGKTAGEPHSGYYSQEDVKRILRYARQRHIKIIPEIEMPGHASAAIASYPFLGSSGLEIEVPVKFGKHYPTFNVASDTVKQFLKDVIDEVITLFETDIIHIGGDEVRFDEWETNKEINDLKEKNNFESYMDVQIHFTNMMSHYIQSKGARMIGWNEILGRALHEDDNIFFTSPSQQVANNVIVQYWKGDPEEIVRAVMNGYDIINSHHEYTYLDYTFNQIPLEKSYKFQPISPNIPNHLKHKVIGIGCQMWGEWAPTSHIIHKKTYPRIAAYAEVAWTPHHQKDYHDFLKRLPYFENRWKRKGINYTNLAEIGGNSK